MKVSKMIKQFIGDESGATAIEYALILATIFLVIITAITLFADNATAKLKLADDAITGAG